MRVDTVGRAEALFKGDKWTRFDAACMHVVINYHTLLFCRQKVSSLLQTKPLSPTGTFT